MLVDVSDSIWEFVSELSGCDITTFRESEIFCCWNEMVASRDATFVFRDPELTDDDDVVFRDVSSLFHTVLGMLRTRGDARFPTFDTAYSRVCNWCEMDDCVTGMTALQLSDQRR